MYLFVGGTMDAYQRVEGVLDAAPQSECSMRFFSSRTNLPREQQRIAAGAFKLGIIYSIDDKLSDFSAQLSCDGSSWRTVAPSSVFAHSSGAPIDLGTIHP